MNKCGNCKYYEGDDVDASTPINQPLMGICGIDPPKVECVPVGGPDGTVGLQKFNVERRVRRLRIACERFKRPVELEYD